MMAESAKTPFDAPDWIFEIKLDDYGLRSCGKPHLWSRNGLAVEAKFPAAATAVSKLKLRSTVVAVDENGIPRFQLCKGSKSNQRRRLSTMSLTSFGITEKTLQVTQSLNVGKCSNAL